MTTVALQNLGCSKNIIDGERILHLFVSAGHSCTSDFTKAEIIIVNTCAFIREAQEEAIESILEMASQKRGGCCRTLIVSGCFSQRYRAKVQEQFPEVDLWVGVDDWEKLLSSQFKTTRDISYERELSEPAATQFLKIAEGCSHVCTFCVIPAIRGKFRSRSSDSILAEARWLYEKGVRECILVAQDSSFYGTDTGTSLVRLLERLLKEVPFHWIRTMYLHPNYVTDELLRLVANEERLCPYFDIPLQHIADKVLGAMNRRPLTKEIYGLIDKIRTLVPQATLRSSFILGFPGETENQFRELLRFIEFARFDKLGVFPFSPEEGTKAYALHPRPRTTTAARRCETLMLAQREISREILESKIGRTVEIIVDGVSENPDFNFSGRTSGDAPEIDGNVLITGGSMDPGSFATVRIIGSSDYDLLAELPA